MILVPVAVLSGMLGSFAGGIAISVLGSQSLTDAGSAFLGSFSLAFTAGLIAPSKRGKTTIVVAGVIILLAILSFVLSVGTNIEEFADRPTLDRILIPVAQILGALFAIFLLPPMVVPGATLEDLWREISVLGSIVVLLGILISLVGLLVGLLGTTWVGFTTGLGVIVVGAATWLFPLVHLFSRIRKVEKAFRDELQPPED